jgi:hypothetical protein
MTTDLKMDERPKGYSLQKEEAAAAGELSEILSPEEDKRILRKLDMWYE